MSNQRMIEELVRVVVRENLINFKEYCDDTDTKQTAADFKTFGVSGETVTDYITYYLPAIVDELTKVQSTMADVLFE